MNLTWRYMCILLALSHCDFYSETSHYHCHRHQYHHHHQTELTCHFESCTKGIGGQLSIDTLDQHLNGHFISTLNQQSVDSWVSVYNYVLIDIQYGMSQLLTN